MDSIRPTGSWSNAQCFDVPRDQQSGTSEHRLPCGAGEGDSTQTAIESFGPADLQEEFSGTDRFRLEEKLGIGGMGTVWRAYDCQRAERVALKAAHYRSVHEVARLKHEFRSLAVLSHPGIVVPYELHQEAPSCFFTMELIEGLDWLVHVRHGMAEEGRNGTSADSVPAEPARSSRALMCREQFDRLRRTFVQLGDVLDYLHERGFVHGDVKPTNVLVTPEGGLVLIDFGLIYKMGDQETPGRPRPCLAGTAAYMAPELADGAEPTPAVDSYAAGVMLFEAISGRVPFRGTFHEVMAAKRTRGPSAIHLDAPRDLVDLCRALLEPDPERRAAAGAIRRALEPAATVSVQPLRTTVTRRATSAADDAAIRRLETALGQATSERTTLAVVEGTCAEDRAVLMEAFRRRVTAQNRGLAFAGRCRETENLPCKAFDEALDQFVGHLSRLSRPFVERLLPGETEFAELTSVFPAFACLAAQPAVSRPAATDNGDTQCRAFAALAELLRRLSALVPIVLLIDDVEWDDVASADLAASLFDPGDIRLLLVLGCRPEKEANSHILHRLCSHCCWRDYSQLQHEITISRVCKTCRGMGILPRET